MKLASIDREHTRANLKIQDGCDFFCSFCEIPFARGRARSRVFEDIFTEAQALVAAGHKEIILTGINVGTYSYQDKTLVDVIKGLNAIEGLERVRVSSIEPTTISPEIFNFMSGSNKLCRYLHVPLQSGNDEILRGMKRKYTVDDFSSFIRRAYAQVPQISIGTDVMAGFPGESDAHFERTLEVLETLPIHYFHVFSYSPRSMSKSRLMSPPPAQVVRRRSSVLRELSRRKRRQFYESLLGSVQTVLFEHKKSDGWQYGLTDNYVRVKILGPRDLFNQLLSIRLKSIDGQALVGELP
jgi:threonylcarbamoyladenosine tRNA methylthiotransferase MtaB